MNLKRVLATIEFLAFVACIYFGVRWYIDPSGINEPPFAVSAFVATILMELIRRHTPSSGIDPEKLVEFIQEGQALHARVKKGNLTIQEITDWVDCMNIYFRQHKGRTYEVRLSDFSGMTFLGDASERSQMSRAIDGRVRRLHEFISELGSKAK